MDFCFSDEQIMFKDSVQRFMQDTYPFKTYELSARSTLGYSQAIWKQFAEMEWLALPFTEADGGHGLGPIELLLLAEELGRGLCIEPYLANIVLAGQIIATQGTAEQRARLMPGLLDGSQQISLAHTELAGRFDLARCDTEAKPATNGFRLSGKKSVVLNAPNADAFIVVGRTSKATDSCGGLSLFIVARDAPGLTLRSYPILGGGVAGELTLNKTPGELLGEIDTALTSIEDVIDLATAFTCAEAYGAMQAMLVKTVEYSKTRKQFGAPLSSFQILQHRMVDMFNEVHQSQSMILMVMLKLGARDRTEKQLAVSACKAYLHKASKYVAQQSVQLHGGVGLTEELDIGHYFRRLSAFGSLLGDREHHLGRFTALSMQIPAALN